MKIVLDTNVVLDVLADREPFVEDSEAVLNCVAQGNAQGAITANSITDLAYLLRKQLSRDALQPVLTGLMELLQVISVNADNCTGAFDLDMDDYEDALLAHCARKWNADYIVTRNQKDFVNSPVPAITPCDFMELLIEQESE